MTMVKKRFAEWIPWYGHFTRRWWAMPPRGFRPQRLVEGTTPDELASAIRTAGGLPPSSHPRNQEARPTPKTQPTTESGTLLGHSWRLDGHETPVRLARRATAESVVAWHVAELADAAVLVVSEL